MRSELHFFMVGEDEREFLGFAATLVDKVESSSEAQWFLIVEDCPIQFLRSKWLNGTLISGRIAIATHGFGVAYQGAEKAERVYKRLRSWIRKTYSNEVTCRNIYSPDSCARIKNFWLGPELLTQLRNNRKIVLKQIPDGFVVFEVP